jgi:hypothetical protein
MTLFAIIGLVLFLDIAVAPAINKNGKIQKKYPLKKWIILSR